MKKYDTPDTDDTKDDKAMPKLAEGLAKLTVAQLSKLMTAVQGELETRASEGEVSHMSNSDYEKWASNEIAKASKGKH